MYQQFLKHKNDSTILKQKVADFTNKLQTQRYTYNTIKSYKNGSCF